MTTFDRILLVALGAALGLCLSMGLLAICSTRHRERKEREEEEETHDGEAR